MKPFSRTKARPDAIETAIEGAFRPGDFVPERATWSFVSELEAVEKKVAALVATDPARAVALFETFLAGAYEKAEELDDSSGNFGMFVDGLYVGWILARQAAHADPAETGLLTPSPASNAAPKSRRPTARDLPRATSSGSCVASSS